MSINLLIVTGYLGSGKTTLLREFKAAIGKATCHFIINEAGQVALDQTTCDVVDDEATVVAGGCACCVKKQGLIDALKDIIDNRRTGARDNNVYIVIETSGLANPAPIVFSVTTDEYLRHHVRIAGVVCAIGSVETMGALEHYPSAGEQLAMADAIVLTKTDRVDASTLARTRGHIALQASDCPIFLSGTTTVDWTSVLASLGSHSSKTHMAAGPVQAGATENSHGGITNCVLRIHEPLDWTAFGVWLSALLARHGESIVRVKGVIPVIDWQGERFHVLINGVQHVMYPPEHVAHEQSLPKIPALVFFFRSISSHEIRRSLRQFYRSHLNVDDLNVSLD